MANSFSKKRCFGRDSNSVGIGKKRMKQKDFCGVTIRKSSWDQDEIQMRKSGGGLR